jgi:large subunit ribosomal protein L16
MEINKFKKKHKQTKIGTNEKNSLRSIKKGNYGLKVLKSGVITPKQIEAARRVITRITKRTGKIFINIYCNHPITKKPLLSRMGKGAGNVQNWVAYVKKGKVIIEIQGVSVKLIIAAFKSAETIIPIKLLIIEREINDV